MGIDLRTHHNISPELCGRMVDLGEEDPVATFAFRCAVLDGHVLERHTKKEGR